MAAIFQDGRQTGHCYMILRKFHSANCDNIVSVGMNRPNRSIFQKKNASHEKIQNGGHIQDGRQMDSFIPRSYMPLYMAWRIPI